MSESADSLLVNENTINNINLQKETNLLIGGGSNTNLQDNSFINLDTLNINMDNTNEPINLLNSPNDMGDSMKELDISSLVKTDDLLNFNNNFELTSTSNNSNENNLYNQLNNNNVIKNEVINSLNLNTNTNTNTNTNKDNSSIYLFDDAPLIE